MGTALAVLPEHGRGPSLIYLATMKVNAARPFGSGRNVNSTRRVLVIVLTDDFNMTMLRNVLRLCSSACSSLALFGPPILFFLVFATLLREVVLADAIPVRYLQGLSRGFLVVRSLDGHEIAEGDSIQVATQQHVTSRMTFRFKDGSIEDETTVFSQRGTFRLISDHMVQKGPSFKHPMETYIDAVSGRFVVHYTDEEGKQKTLTKILDLPPDISNGMLLTLLTNVQPNVPSTTISYLAATPEPRLIHLVITPRTENAFVTGTSKHKAMDYDVKVQIGGVAGVAAHLLEKQPADTNVWVLLGEAPTFVGLEGPFYAEGPTWRVDLVSPARDGISANK
jgi:hypothetical protein